MNDEPDSVRQLAPHIPRPLAELIERLMRKAPAAEARRHISVRDFDLSVPESHSFWQRIGRS